MKERGTSWIEKRLLDAGRHYLLAGGEPITDLGKIYFESMVDDIKTRKQTPFSKYFGVLNGYKISIEGSNFLEDLRDKGAFFLSNHTDNGPLRNGRWKLFATNYLVKQLTGKEIRWTYGQDRSTFQEFFRKSVTQSVNAIPVREGTGIAGIREILKAFQSQDSVGLYPEGDGRKELIRGNSKAGGIMLFAARQNVPIVSISAWFEKAKYTCHLNFTLLDSELIKSMGGSSNKEQAKQEIVDYAMAEIAKNMPRELRGYYGAQ